MDPNHEAPQEPFVLPLEQWANLLSLREQTSSEASGAGHRKPPSDVETKSWRQQRTVVVTCMASCIVDLLLKNVLDNDEDVPLSERPPSIEAADISIDNFMVALNLEVDVESLGPNQLSAADIIEKCTLEQIKNAIETEVQVDFASAELRQKRAIDVNEKLEHAFFVNLGQLFYKLFLPKPLSSRDEESDVPNEPAEEKKINDPNEYRDEEEPGAEKGRRKHAIHETCKSFKNVSISAVYNELQQQMLPTSICRLVGDLIETGPSNNCGFETMNDVLGELRQIVDDPQTYLFENIVGQKEIDFRDDLLFGRHEEAATLLTAIVNARAESQQFVNNLIVINGLPGSGKSHLFKSLERPLFDAGWTHLKCKFDRLSQNQASSTIASAFDGFFRDLVPLRSRFEDGHQDLEMLALMLTLTNIENYLTRAGIATLAQVMPSLRALFPGLFQRVVEDEDEISDDDYNGPNDNDHEDSHKISNQEEEDDCLTADTYKTRLHYLFKRLVRVITSPQSPAILFLDDVQWADSASLDLVSSLLTSSRHFQLIGDDDEGPNSHCLVVVATYRSDEVDANHLVSRYLEDLEQSDNVHTTNINLEGLDKEGTNALISHALQLPSRLTREFGGVVHSKTSGNPLFVKSFTQSLEMDGLMHYSLERKRWMWDIETVKSRAIDDGVVSLLNLKVQAMPENVQFALLVLSCFGMQVDGEVLELLSTSEQFRQILPSLEKAISDGIVLKSESRYLFPHDLIQESVYHVGYRSVDRLHFDIGVQILGQIPTGSDAPFGRISFAAIDQINAATSIHVTDPNQRILFASCNLRASNRLVEQANAYMALVYAEHGLRYLGGWELDFQLCLQLNETACLACYINGAVDRVQIFAEEIMSHTENLFLRVKTLYVMIRVLGTTEKQQEAMEEALRTLDQLGVHLPHQVIPNQVQSEIIRTMKLLSNFSPEKISSTPILQDKKKQWQMRILDVMIPYVYAVNSMYTPIVSCHMIEISLRHGLSPESAFGFAYFGSTCTSMGRFQEAYRLGKLAFEILKRFDAKTLYPKLKYLCHGFLFVWVEPLQSTERALAECYEEGLMVGEVEYAMNGMAMSCSLSYLIGKSLSVVEKDAAACIQAMMQKTKLFNIRATMSIQKAISTLTGREISPFTVSHSSIKDEDELISTSSPTPPTFTKMIYTNRMVLAAFFNQFQTVAFIAEKLLTIVHHQVRHHDIYVQFYHGIAAFHLSRSEGDNSKWMSVGNGSILQFQSWVENSQWNFSNKLWLLEAESHFSKGEFVKAEEKYIASIESAHKHRFIHEQGLANELLSSLYKKLGRLEDARECMSKAVSCYKEWGAHGLLSESRFNGFISI